MKEIDTITMEHIFLTMTVFLGTIWHDQECNNFYIQQSIFWTSSASVFNWFVLVRPFDILLCRKLVRKVSFTQKVSVHWSLQLGQFSNFWAIFNSLCLMYFVKMKWNLQWSLKNLAKKLFGAWFFTKLIFEKSNDFIWRKCTSKSYTVVGSHKQTFTDVGYR